MEDKLLLILARNFSVNLQFHMWKNKIAMATFGATFFFDTINKSKTRDCKRNLSPVILKGNQMVYS